MTRLQAIKNQTLQRGRRDGPDLPRTHGTRAWRRPIRLRPRLKHLPFGKYVAVVTDARFSGVSTGACIGHVSPEALAGGPIGKMRDGDLIEIIIDRANLWIGQFGGGRQRTV